MLNASRAGWSGRKVSIMTASSLVVLAHDRLEVLDVEGPGIEHPVPADHVEGVVVQGVLVEPVVLLDQDAELALLIVGLELHRPAKVPLAVGRALEHLAVFVAVAPR